MIQDIPRDAASTNFTLICTWFMIWTHHMHNEWMNNDACEPASLRACAGEIKSAVGKLVSPFFTPQLKPRHFLSFSPVLRCAPVSPLCVFHEFILTPMFLLFFVLRMNLQYSYILEACSFHCFPSLITNMTLRSTLEPSGGKDCDLLFPCNCIKFNDFVT